MALSAGTPVASLRAGNGFGERKRAMREVLLGLGLLAITVLVALTCQGCGSSDGGGGAGDDEEESDEDQDWGDDDWTEDEGDDCDDGECEFLCEPGYIVPLGPGTTPAVVETLCAAPSTPVFSPASAVVELDTVSGTQSAATGFVSVPDEILDRVLGPPEITFTGSGPDWGTAVVTLPEAVDGGFVFSAQWPLLPPVLYCDVGDAMAHIQCRVRFTVACGGEDGGVSGDAGASDGGATDGGSGETIEIVAVTNFQWCYDEALAPDWWGSGETCPNRCRWYWECWS
jgi:hypothetical protein